MLLFARIIFIGVIFIASNMNLSFAAGVPVSDPTSTSVTCDPAFWTVLKNRAWQEGQREITQNQNLIARTDSVLSMTCFESFATHLSKYGSQNFPSSPQHSLGPLGGAITTGIIAIDDALYSSAGAAAYEGYVLYAAIELLVLDQLMSGITNAATQAMDVPDLLPCTGKEYYIESNFPPLMIGYRAISGGGFAAIPSLASGAALANYNGCKRMDDVWKRSKCYDFASEASHDGFFSLKDYSSGSDYRTKVAGCYPPRSDGSPSFLPFNNSSSQPSDVGLACDAKVHSIPSSWSNASLQAFFSGNVVPTWSSAYAGGFGSAGDLIHYFGLRDTTKCSSLQPIKTGYIVKLSGGTKYVDSVCPAPGCYFMPPTSISGTGTCQ